MKVNQIYLFLLFLLTEIVGLERKEKWTRIDVQGDADIRAAYNALTEEEKEELITEAEELQTIKASAMKFGHARQQDAIAVVDQVHTIVHICSMD